MGQTMRHLYLLLIAIVLGALQPSAATASTTWTGLIRTQTDGRVVLSWAALRDAGLPAATDVTTMQCWRNGRELPIQVDASGITVVAQANDSPWSTEATYWLTVGTTAGQRTILPTTPTTPYRWEADQVYQSLVQSERGDSWFAAELRTGSDPVSLMLTLPEQLPAGSQIDLALTPYTVQAGHTLNVWAGNVLIGQVTWDDSQAGPRHVLITTQHPLPAGEVALSLTLTSASSDVILLDNLAIPSLLIPLPTITPPVIAPRPAPPLASADQLIIGKIDLLSALAPLVALKQQQGNTIVVADVEAVYDHYSWGERSPEAIRAYIQAVAPKSVLLLGAGNVRMRVQPDETDPTVIPPYLVRADGVYGAIACDTCYTRSGADPLTTLLPAMPIGRLPARTLAEAAVMIGKVIANATPPAGSWANQMLLVSDNDRDAFGTPDSAGPFTPLVDAFRSGLPQLQAQQFIYAPDQPSNAGPYKDAPALRTKLFTAWDQGAALMLYTGHANAWQWSFTGPTEPVAHLVSRHDAVRTNGSRLPILLSMTCLSGAFANPIMASIDEELLRQPGGGIVAALTPAGSGVNTGHATLLAGALPVLASGGTLGKAHMAALAQLLTTPKADWHLAFSYNLLGDPDVRLPQPHDALVYLPGVQR